LPNLQQPWYIRPWVSFLYVVPVADFPFAADISRPLSGPFNEAFRRRRLIAFQTTENPQSR